MTKAVNLAQVPSSGTSYAYKNKLFNGSMQVWQRGTSAASLTTSGYKTADRWYHAIGGTMTSARSSTLDSPNNNYSLVLTSNQASSFVNVLQGIEQLNVYPLRGQTVTFSFWYKLLSGTFTGVIAGTLFYSNSSDAVNISTGGQTATGGNPYGTPSSSWQQLVVSYYVPTDAVGLSFCMQLSSTQASGVSWALADAQVEVGTTATNFDLRPIGTEVQLCQRYFEKSFDIETAPANGASGTTVSSNNGLTTGWSTNGTYGGMHIRFATAKRAAPSIQGYGNSSGYWYAGAWGVNAIAFGYIGTAGFTNNQQQVGGQQLTYGHWAASAEL